jgi:hypothetical protein
VTIATGSRLGAARIARLEAFEKCREPVQLDYAKVIGKEGWNQYQQLLAAAVSQLSTAQEMALRFLKLANRAVG